MVCGLHAPTWGVPHGHLEPVQGPRSRGRRGSACLSFSGGRKLGVSAGSTRGSAPHQDVLCAGMPRLQGPNAGGGKGVAHAYQDLAASTPTAHEKQATTVSRMALLGHRGPAGTFWNV